MRERTQGVPLEKMCRRSCAVAAGGGLVYAFIAQKPWATGVAADLAAGRIPEVRDCVVWGFWWASLLTAAVGAILALTVPLWTRPITGRWEVALPGESPLSRRVFAGIVAGIVAVSAVAAWPRLHHSLWGDEESAVARYVVGFTMPKDPENLDGPLRHPSVRWSETAFGDQGGGNNHYLYSLLARAVHEAWRSLGKHRPWEFDEAVLRSVPFVAGLLALWAWASVGRRLGRPRAGLTAAALMACHPWQVRFCTEARGYSLMMLFFGLMWWALIAAIETGTAWSWTAFAAAELATLHAWKGMIYPLAALNLVLGGCLWRKRAAFPDRFPRWLVASAIAAASFIWLTLPAQPQIAATRAKIAGHGNQPFTPVWAADLLGETLTGVPVEIADAANPLELSLHRLVAAHPIMVGVGMTGLAAATVAGVLCLFRRRRLWLALFAAVPAGATLAAIHFKLVMKIELLNWYWTFCVPVGCLILGLGAVEVARRTGPRKLPAAWAPLATVGCLAAITAPALFQARSVPAEAFRDAVMLVKGKIDTPADARPPAIRTAWLWRYAKLYDPRGLTRVRTLDDLRHFENEAQKRGQEVCVIEGYPPLAHALTPEVVDELEHSGRYFCEHVFWAQQPQHTLFVYRLKTSGRKS